MLWFDVPCHLSACYLVLTDLAVEKWRVWRGRTPRWPRVPAAEAMAYGFEALCQIPEGVYLANQHTWVKPDPAGGLEMGADALIVRAVGAVRRIILPKVGDQVTAGQPLFRLGAQWVRRHYSLGPDRSRDGREQPPRRSTGAVELGPLWKRLGLLP